MWLGHNNDLGPDAEDELIALEWRVPGDPVLFTIGIGAGISVGFNSAGLALTGNELSPSDDRVGIPRLLLVRDILRRRTLDRGGRGGASPAAGIVIQQPAVAPRRRRRERRGLGHRRRAPAARPAGSSPIRTTTRTPGWPGTSAIRARSPVPWPATRTPRAGSTTGRSRPDSLREALSDHTGAPDSLCRHIEDGAESKTVFWCVADVTEGTIRYGRGNPCDSEEQRYDFD